MAAQDPRILLILQALATRLAAISSAGGAYHTDIGATVRRGRKRLTGVPACSIYLDGQTVTTAAPARAVVEARIAIEAYAAYGSTEPEDVGCRMLEDIRVALETTDRTLGGLLHRTDLGGLTWDDGEIVYPEEQDSIVGVRVIYTAPYIRKAD